MNRRGAIALLTSLWLINVMSVAQLLVTLRRLRVPAVFVAILAVMYRCVFVVWNELDHLPTVRKARSMSHTCLLFRWKSLAAMLGTLLIRSLTRAERMHGDMLSGG
ncbi:MAG: CbiQ family ECF transporter T component [Planctomycetota bacterium]